MSTEIIRRQLGWVLTSVLAVVFGSAAMAASIPVEDSKPMGQSGVSVTVATPQNDHSVNSTAHLLNTLEQMRQQIMEMQGQLEEQAFRIKQLEQEGRDRYLDLDERLSRLSSQSANDLDTAQPPLPSPTLAGASSAGVREAVRVESRKMRGNYSSGEAEKKQGEPTVKSDSTEKTKQAEEAAYQAAFELIRSRQFDQAKTALKQQLKTYPDGSYADNAYYWLGEVDMAQGRYKEAGEEFQKVLSLFPDSPKVPDASYKLGRVYDLLGKRGKAESLLEAVIQKYPNSAAARLADTYLRTMSP